MAPLGILGAQLPESLDEPGQRPPSSCASSRSRNACSPGKNPRAVRSVIPRYVTISCVAPPSAVELVAQDRALARGHLRHRRRPSTRTRDPRRFPHQDPPGRVIPAPARDHLDRARRRAPSILASIAISQPRAPRAWRSRPTRARCECGRSARTSASPRRLRRRVALFHAAGSYTTRPCRS